MKPIKLLYVVAIAAAFAGNADAVYKCTTAKGVVYQDRPCLEGAQTDVEIVVPTGGVVAKDRSASGEAAAQDAPRAESRFGAPKPGRTATADSSAPHQRGALATDAVSGARPATDTSNAPSARGTGATNRPAVGEAARADVNGTHAGADAGGTPMTAEQAGNTMPTAKYYSTDAVAPGNETPTHMTCESPTGEKRVFILLNGKLTSI